MTLAELDAYQDPHINIIECEAFWLDDLNITPRDGDAIFVQVFEQQRLTNTLVLSRLAHCKKNGQNT